MVPLLLAASSARSTENQTEGLRRLCIATGFGDRLSRVADSQVGQRFKAIAYSIAQTGGDEAAILKNMRSIADGKISALSNHEVSALTGLVQRVVEQDRTVAPFINAANRSLESPLDAPASAALAIAGVAANSVASSRSAAAASLRDSSSRILALATVAAADRNSFVASLVNSAQYAQLTTLDIKQTLTSAIGTLPTSARNLATEIEQRLGRADTNAVDFIQLADSHLGGAFSSARKEYSQAAEAVRAGKSLFEASRGSSLQDAQAELAAVSIVSSYVLGNLLGDKQAAQQVSQAMQVGATVLQLGLMFSTGGVGVMAGAGGVMSSVGALQGLFGGGGEDDNSAALTSMLGQISAQIEDLRHEMNVRFDRMETLEKTAISMLQTIAIDLRGFKVEANEKLDGLSSDLVQLDHYVRSSDRDKLWAAFEKDVGLLNVVITSPPGTYSLSQKQDRLVAILQYAIRGSTASAFTFSDFQGEDDNFPGAVTRTTRIDLGFGLLPRAGRILGLSAVANLPSQNLIEWARATEAFLEAQVRLGFLKNDEINREFDTAKSAGDVALAFLSKFVCAENNALATKGFLAALEAVIGVIQDSLSSVRSHPLSVGLLNFYQFGMNFLYSERLGQPGKQYHITHTFPSNQDYRIQSLTRDPFTFLVDAGVIRLDEYAVEQFTKQRMIQGGLVATEVIATIHRYRAKIGVANLNETDLGEIARFNFAEGFPSAWSAWDTRKAWTGPHEREGGPDFRLQMFLNRITQNANEGATLRKWIETTFRPTAQVDRECKNFERVSAAFALYAATAAWASTDVVDAPYSSSIVRRSYRNMADVIAILGDLTEGLSTDNFALLGLSNVGLPPEKQLRVWGNADADGFIRWNTVRDSVSYGDVAGRILRARMNRALAEFSKVAGQESGQVQPSIVSSLMEKAGAYKAALST